MNISRKKEKVFSPKQLGMDNLRDLGLDNSRLTLNKKIYNLKEEDINDKFKKGVRYGK